MSTFTDGEIYLLGTVPTAELVDKDRSGVKSAVESFKAKTRGLLVLFQATDKTKSSNCSRNRQTYLETTEIIKMVAENIGYFIFRDKILEILYCNDVQSTPCIATEEPNDYTNYSVHSLAPLY